MSSLRILCQDHPQRTIVLATAEHALIFQYCSADPAPNVSNEPPRCLVKFSGLSSVDLKGYRFLGNGYGTLGLITLDEDVFLCVVTGSSKAATVRPGETVLRIENVDFCIMLSPGFPSYLFGRTDVNSLPQSSRLWRATGLWIRYRTCKWGI